MNIKKILASALLFLIPSISSQAYWVWSPESGKFVNPEKAVQDTADEQYDYAMKFYKEKDLSEAAKQLEQLLKKYPGSRIAAEAQYRLGTVYEEQGDFMKAFKAYKVLVESYPQSERLGEVIEREFRIANLFLSGKKAKLMGLEILPSLPRAVEIFEHITKQAPFSEFGDKAQFHLGLAYKKWAHYEEAAEAFQAVIDRYPKSDLLAQARFQLAETSFQRSSAEFRDQRALDEASQEIERFLSRHPDTTASEKAGKLRQQIDEKNAEKNYRIGLYYEKDNYVSSALIYYADVAARYAHTKWGGKAQEKLKSLERPAEYISGEEKKINEEKKVIETKLQGLPESQRDERRSLEQELEGLKKREKAVGKSKKESLARREQDINRRERELKQKFKNLQEKKKQVKKNPSEDFKKALERWESSLISERETLASERKQVREWRETLGVPKRFSADFLPFVEEPRTELEKIQRIGTKKLYELSRSKKSLLNQKEALYKRRSEITALLDQAVSPPGLTASPAVLKTAAVPLAPTAGEDGRISRERLEAAASEIRRLEKELDAKRRVYDEAHAAQGASVWKMLNPFDGSDLKKKSLQELLERRMHLKEKISVQQSLVETLSHAFDTELALQEQKRLLADLEAPENPDPQVLRKSMRRLEKDIQSRYREIQDRHRQKEKWVEELDRLLKQKRSKDPILVQTARLASQPVKGFFRFWKSFLFGLPHKEVEVTQSAASLAPSSVETERAVELKEAIELESLMIEGKTREMENLGKELEILKAKASLAGGFKFRSVLVDLPYQFIQEAVESAKLVVPKKSRQEILVRRLEGETRELESLKAEIREIEILIDKKAPPSPSPLPGGERARVRGTPDEGSGFRLQKEIEELSERLEKERQIHQHEKSLADAVLKKSNPATEGEEKLSRHLEEVESELTRLVSKEKDLEKEESAVLEHRIQEIDRVIPKIQSQALSQDLLTERQRIEERLSQLESRQSFLSRELERFQIQESAAARPS